MLLFDGSKGFGIFITLNAEIIDMNNGVLLCANGKD